MEETTGDYKRSTQEGAQVWLFSADDFGMADLLVVSLSNLVALAVHWT